MSATLYTIFGLVIAAFGTIGYPMWDNHRKKRTALVEQRSEDSRYMASEYKDDRDRLQLRVDTMAIAHDQQIRAVRAEAAAALATAESKWRAQHEADQAQIAELRTELYQLYRSLGRPHPGS